MRHPLGPDGSMFTRLHGTDVLCCPKHLEFEMRDTCSCVEDVRCGACMTGAVDPMTGRTTPPVWTDARIREAFIYDGGEAEYHDPISGAQTQRQVAGSIFDAWLAAHDAALLAALTTPPSDDVREALAREIADGGEPFDEDYRAADDVLRRFEVRPRGTVTDAEALRLGKVAWVAYQDDKSWAESVVEDCFSPADDLPEEALDMIAVARAVLEADRGVRP